MTKTNENTFREHLQILTLETWDLWDIWSEWWGNMSSQDKEKYIWRTLIFPSPPIFPTILSARCPEGLKLCLLFRSKCILRFPVHQQGCNNPSSSSSPFPDLYSLSLHRLKTPKKVRLRHKKTDILRSGWLEGGGGISPPPAPLRDTQNTFDLKVMGLKNAYFMHFS